MSTVSQNISVELPFVSVRPSRYVVQCGETVAEMIEGVMSDVWRPSTDLVESVDMDPADFDTIEARIKLYVVRKETSRLMHLRLGSVLGEL